MLKSGSYKCAKDLMPLQVFKSVICDINTGNSLLTADAFVDNLLWLNKLWRLFMNTLSVFIHAGAWLW